MVLVPLKKTLTLYFARVCLYCSLRPFMYDMTNSSCFYNPSYGKIWLFVWVCLVERTVLDSGCLVGLCEGDPFLLQYIKMWNILI